MKGNVKRQNLVNTNQNKYALNDNLRFLASIVQSSEDAIISEALDGTITSWNPAAEKMFGYSEREALGKPMSIIGPPDRIEEFESFIDQVKKGIKVEWYETQRKRKNGSLIDVLVTVSPVRDEQGRLIGLSAIDRDISAQKQASQYARSLIEASLDPLVTISADGKITDVNEATIKVTGVSRERLVGTDFANYFTEPEKALEGYKQVLAKGYVTDYPLTIRHNDGKHTDVLYNASVYKDITGNVLGVFAAARDITAQKQAQEALRKAHDELEMRVQERTRELIETRDYLDNLFNYANAPIIVWNPEFKITRFNHAFERLTGRTADEVLGEELDILFPDDSRDESMKHICKATSGERWEVVEIPIKHKDGTVYILLWNSATIYAPDGKTTVATIAQGQDITDRKRVEKLKDEFIGLVSHELRTPMTVITGSLQTAMSKGISLEDKEVLLQNAVEGAGSLSTILENMLELSRSQAGRLQIHRETVNMADIAKSVIEKLKTSSEGYRFLVDFPDDLPPVEADPVRVERIVYNLLENAVKYSPEGSEIKVFARAEKRLVVTGVADKGIGISPEDRGRIFELFERLEKLSRTQGIGLGLVVCKRLVAAQGGSIWVDSEPGKGSTFYFTLPMNRKTA